MGMYVILVVIEIISALIYTYEATWCRNAADEVIFGVYYEGFKVVSKKQVYHYNVLM